MNLIDLLKVASETEKLLFIICGIQLIGLLAVIARTDNFSWRIKYLEDEIKRIK